MAKRYPDTVRVEAEGIGSFDRFTSLAISYDLTAPSEAAFEVGDDGSWKELKDYIKPGTKYRVYVNNALKLTGKAILNDVPIDERGSVVRFSVRTKLADAMYASADPKTRVSGTSVKDFVLALYAPLGFGPGDFVFDADVSRNLLTGVARTGAKPPPEFESMLENKAKVQPPESIYAAADKHLRRFGLMHWDSPDGKIVVGAPDDEQMRLLEQPAVSAIRSRLVRAPVGARRLRPARGRGPEPGSDPPHHPRPRGDRCRVLPPGHRGAGGHRLRVARGARGVPRADGEEQEPSDLGPHDRRLHLLGQRENHLLRDRHGGRGDDDQRREPERPVPDPSGHSHEGRGPR
jgi:hypothetical protein